MKITYYGHSAFGFELDDGTRIMIDPFISGNPDCPASVEDLKADYIIITHAHGDHVGDTFRIADKAHTQIIAVTELGGIIAKMGYRTHGIQIGGAFNFPFGRVKLTMALHGSVTDEGQYAGLASGVLLTVDDTTIYHTGDTGLFGDMKLIGEMNDIDYLMVPIGGYYTMDIEDALKAVEFVQPRIVIPMHYNTFPRIKADPEQFCARVKAKGFDCMVLKAGASI